MEKKVYQLIVRRLDGDRIGSAAYRKKIFEHIDRGIGGFILFGGERDEIRTVLDEMQSAAEVPLFIASDIERGVGQQLRGCSNFPCQMAVSAGIDRSNSGDVDLLERGVTAIAEETKDIGINMPLIPVLDVNQNPDNPIICTRAFSDNPRDVAWFGKKYTEILESAGLISCAKHFPGHGDTSSDSHILLPVISKSYDQLMAVDILPFKEAVEAGASSIMVGHLRIPSVDLKPASLSRRIITDILRSELGFDGLVLTDALNMHALQDISDVSVQCLQAGADILLHPADPEGTVRELMDGLASKKITEEQIDAALQRIMKAKKRFEQSVPREIDYEHHKALASLITDMSISLVRKKAGLLPVAGRDTVQLIFAGDPELFQASPLKNCYKSWSIAIEGIGAEQDICIFAVFTNIAAWKGSSGINDDEKKRIQELMSKARHSIVISFGSPYVLRHFPEADVLIAAYEATEQAQTAVVQCLEGLRDFKGRLPVESDI
jgi:beta-glucosidase-like glycosyl hydrolase